MNSHVFEIILQNSQDVFMLFSLNKKISWMNNTAKTLLTKLNLSNANEKLFFDDKLAKKICGYENIENMLDKTWEFSIEPDVEIEWNCKKIIDEKTNAHYCCLSGKYTTKIKQLQKEIFNLKNIINSTPGFVFWKDKNCVLQGCNQNFATQVGLKHPNDIQGKTDHELPWSKEETERFLIDDSEVMTSGIAKINIEENQTQKNGKVSTLLTSKIPLRDKENKITGILGTYFDITERKEAEKLAIERKIFEEKLKVSQNLAGVMAHELRTPLASFKLILDLIKAHATNSTMDADEKIEHILNMVEKGNDVDKSSRELIDMILFKIRSMNNKLDREKFQLCLIKDDIASILNKYAFDKGERDLIHVNSNNAFIYFGDKVATGHVLANLIKNTLKIIQEEGKGEIKIYLDQSDEKYNKLIFEDNAKGIEPKFLPLMFDSFVYKDSTGKGTGLGLAFCKLVMNDYDGDIICESEFGKYTRFICLFPKVDMSGFDFA